MKKFIVFITIIALLFVLVLTPEVAALCNQDLDCGLVTITESCKDGDLYNYITTPMCLEGGTENSVCGAMVAENLVQDCTLGCVDGKCIITTLNPVLKIINEIIWSYGGYFTGPQLIPDFADQINNALLDCTTEECLIPITLTADSEESITLSDLEVYYTLQELVPKQELYLQGIPDETDDAVLTLKNIPLDKKTIIDWRVNDNSIALFNVPFEANAGSETSTKDYSSNNIKATVKGATFVANGGYDGYGAYSFKPNTAIETNVPYAQPEKGITISSWYTTDDTGAPRMVAVGGNNGGRFESFVVLGKPGCRVYDTGEKSIIADQQFIGGWHHLVCVQTYNPNKTYLYVDGTLRKTTNAASVSAGGYWKIGTPGGTRSRGFNGAIDEVSLFNRALSSEQIMELYSSKGSTLAAQETNLGETWHVAAVFNDGLQNTQTIATNSIVIKEDKNKVTPDLISVDGTNSVNSDLQIIDVMPAPVKNIIDWRLNSNSIALLNMLFESNYDADITAKDYSSFSHNSAVNGAVFDATGGFDGYGAYVFNGKSSITTPLAYTSSKNMSVGGWYKTNDLQTSKMVIIGGNNGGRFEVYVHEGHPGCRVWDTGEKSIFTDEVYDNQWHHVVCVQTNNPAKTFLYVDGILKKTIDAASVSAGGYWKIGASGSRLSNYFKGTIDEIFLYNRALSQEEINKLFKGNTTLLTHQEIHQGETWSVAVTANNGVADLEPIFTNTLTIS
ncbi:LamG domain-containing protein [Candidatus Woesearchaeota archaeon]|nr:LamG domain-containing protein [Candidatus Woesearchaeota archaeon]